VLFLDSQEQQQGETHDDGTERRHPTDLQQVDPYFCKSTPANHFHRDHQ
jgi:hypothetical protein